MVVETNGGDMQLYCEDCGLLFWCEIPFTSDSCPKCGRTVEQSGISGYFESIDNPKQFVHPTAIETIEAICAVNRMDTSDCLDDADWVIENAKMLLRSYTSLAIQMRECD